MGVIEHILACLLVVSAHHHDMAKVGDGGCSAVSEGVY